MSAAARHFAVAKATATARSGCPTRCEALVDDRGAAGRDRRRSAVDRQARRARQLYGAVARSAQAPKRRSCCRCRDSRLEFTIGTDRRRSRALGMTQAVRPGAGGLRGMTGRPRTERRSTIDQIVHRAVIDVTEDGTEAAAATAVVVIPAPARRPKPSGSASTGRSCSDRRRRRPARSCSQGRVSDPQSSSHCEERSDEASADDIKSWIASAAGLAMTLLVQSRRRHRDRRGQGACRAPRCRRRDC